MRHRQTTPQLGRTPAHRKAMLRNMVTDFLRHEKIRTTQAKAKALRPYAEKLITMGKKDNLTARRQAAKVLRDKAVLKKLFDELAPRYADRPGGYTRIIKLSTRAGDNADMAIIELVEAEMGKRKKRKKPSYTGPLTAATEAASRAVEAVGDAAEDAVEAVGDVVEDAAKDVVEDVVEAVTGDDDASDAPVDDAPADDAPEAEADDAEENKPE
ncbi:MAG: 50S ribosomal protein L17 [Acidobacteria bacterium]|nr:50S ribosomal protein L17 [Acidobacteriota bacterium]